MTAALLASVLAAAVAGSAHCASMCGGLVAFGSAGSKGRSRALPLLAYNAARGGGYVLLGAAAGGLGSTLDRAGARVGIGRFAGAVAGALMIAWGVRKLLELAGLHASRRAGQHAVTVPLSRLVRRLRDESPVTRSALVGGCTAALPCGFLHAFVVVAAGTGSAFDGALVLAAFFLGTLPAVAGLGVGAAVLGRPLGRYASAVGALALVAFGLTSLLGRWTPASLSRFVVEQVEEAP